MNVYLADFYNWIMVCLANFVITHISVNLNDIQMCCHDVIECLGHSLYCHLNVLDLISRKKKQKENVSKLWWKNPKIDHLLSIRSTARGIFDRYCLLFWVYDGDIIGDDEDEPDFLWLVRLGFRRVDVVTVLWFDDVDVDAISSPIIIVDRIYCCVLSGTLWSRFAVGFFFFGKSKYTNIFNKFSME